MNDFLQNIGIPGVSPHMIIQGLIIYGLIVWLSLLIWVIRDITNRTRSIALQIIVVTLVFLCMPVGLFLYILFRPQKTLFEKIFEDEFIKLDHSACNTGCEEKKKEPLPLAPENEKNKKSSFSVKKRIKKSQNTELTDKE